MAGNLKKLDHSFYNRKNVVQIARELLGKILVTRFDGIRCAGRIVETEAYNGIYDRASHAFGGRRTNRTAGAVKCRRVALDIIDTLGIPPQDTRTRVNRDE